jgi:predicted peroxiredoxin
MTNDADTQRALINLSTGLEDAERVTVALLVAVAALDAGRRVGIWLTKEAVRLALSGHGVGVACDGCPPVERLLDQYAAAGGELLPCPICFTARRLGEGGLAANARLTGATPMWEWIGAGATVFSF